MLRSFVAALMLAVPLSAQDQQPVDALRTCVADNTSGKDRKDLAKWLFLAMAAHPEMRQLSSANTASAADESSRTMAALLERLLTVSCVSETKAVVKLGQGSQAIKLAFSGLGELAMHELMADKSVNESMSVFERYIDQKRFAEVFGDN